MADGSDMCDDRAAFAALMEQVQGDPEQCFRMVVSRLEESMVALAADAKVEAELRHYFADGLYAREVVLPAGAVFVGKIHKTRHICVISKGDVSVLTPEGVKRIAAPATIIAEPGTKRAVFVHSETVWTNFHATDETDLEKIEAAVIATTFDEVDALAAPAQESASWLG